MKANQGDTVLVHYKGTLADGTVFDSSEGRDPLKFTVGAGQVIPGFDKAVTGLEAGESTIAHIPADEAYGQPRQDMMLVIPRASLPADISPAVGDQLKLRNPQGQPVVGIVTAVSGDSLSVDVNHPLAGKDLIFEITVVRVS